MSGLPIPVSETGDCILVTGGTGYLGQALLPELVARGHRVRALVRPGSENKVPAGVEIATGNALAPIDVSRALAGAHTLVHLVGVPRPNPAKARQFVEIDLRSAQASAAAALQAQPQPHVVYLSVAQPAPVMRAYITARQAGEAALRAAGVRATFIRPWYVLGPGHRWPVFLLPVYAALKRLPATADSARRLDFVTLEQMTTALLHAVQNPPASGIRIVDVPGIKSLAGRS